MSGRAGDGHEDASDRVRTDDSAVDASDARRALSGDDERDLLDEQADELRMGRRELAIRLGRALLAAAVARQSSPGIHQALSRYGWNFRGGSPLLKSIARFLARHWRVWR